MLKNLFTRLLKKPRDRKLHPESDYIITVTGDHVSCVYPGGAVKAFDLANLLRVEIHTNSLGPFLPDVFFALCGENGEELVIPMGATNEQLLLDRLFALPGVDPAHFITGMSCTSDQVFVIWKRNQEAV